MGSRGGWAEANNGQFICDNWPSIFNIWKKAEGPVSDINQDFAISIQRRRNDLRVKLQSCLWRRDNTSLKRDKLVVKPKLIQ